MSSINLLIFIVFLSFVSITYTVVFCFWSLYLSYSTRRKWKSYKRAVKCLQGYFCCQYQWQAYSAKTEFVKYIFLLIMNLVEWTALMSMSVGAIVKYIIALVHCPPSEHFNEECFLAYPQINSLMTSNSMIFSKNCVVLGIILMASLCLYLAANYTTVTWISSKRIPGLITLFLLYITVAQILASFCSIMLISMLLNTMLMTAATVVLFKEYRQLCMVLSWQIVDLGVSKNDILLKRLIKTKRDFRRVFSFILLGLIIIIAFQYIELTLISIGIVLRNSNSSYIDISLCEESLLSTFEKSDLYALLFRIDEYIIGIAILIIYIPYIGYGLSTMYIVIWRLVRGKTGYKTHFHNQTADYNGDHHVCPF